MKCDNMIAVERKSRGEKITIVSAWNGYHLHEKQKDREHLIAIAEECGGTIKVWIQALDEPYFGGSSASLEVEWKCDRCGWIAFEFPTDRDDLCSFINELTEDVTCALQRVI